MQTHLTHKILVFSKKTQHLEKPNKKKTLNVIQYTTNLIIVAFSNETNHKYK